MSEWIQKTLEEIAVSTPSAIVDGPFGSNLKTSDYVEDGIPVLQGNNITRDRFEWRDVRFISKEKAAQLIRSAVRVGDLLVVKIGSVGYAAILTTLHGYQYGIIPANLIKATLDSTIVDTKFVYYLLTCENGKKVLRDLAGNTAQPALSLGKFKSIKFHYPTLPTQRRIGEILSTLDETIEQTVALIVKMQQIKAGLMHDLFTRGVTSNGHLRPTREQAPDLYKVSPLGWIPKEWEVEKLGEILRRCGGYLQTGPFGSQLHAHEYQIEGVPVVMPQDINDGLIGTEQIARIHEARANELARHRMSLGDIVIARRGDLSRAAAITESEQGWVCGTGCFLLRLGQSTLKADFVAQVYRQDFVQRQIAGRAVGTTMPSLNNSVMAGLLFPFCDEDEQMRIVERLGGVEKSIDVLSEGLHVNHQIKHGLMYDLLTGRVRVKLEGGIAQ